MMTDEVFAQQLSDVRLKAEIRRSEEWANIPDRVLGLPLRPITPATFGLLLGTRSAFVCGLRPTVRDVRDYITFHSPEFDPDRPVLSFFARLKIRLRAERALCPLRRAKHAKAVYAANTLTAIRQVREIVARTWADSLPPGEANDGPSVAAALEALLCDAFATEYKFWPLSTPIRHTPIARLFQMRRASDRRKFGAEAIYFDREEAAVTREYLKGLNAEAIRQQNKTPCA